MAPPPKVAACKLDKENRRPPGEPANTQKVSTKANAVTTAPQPVRRLAGPAVSATSPRSATAPRSRPTSAVAARPNPAPAAKRAAPDPWLEVTAATEKADKLEAELAALSAELDAAELAAQEAEAAENEAEQALTAKSGEMLAEYAGAHGRCMKLEEQLRNGRLKLDKQKTDMLVLSRRNIELDRETRTCNEHIAEARELLEQCSQSQGALDFEIAERLAGCDRLREAAGVQRDRLAGDLRRFAAMKARLLELVDSSAGASQGTSEALELIAEADAMSEKTRAAIEACDKAVAMIDPCPEPLALAAEADTEEPLAVAADAGTEDAAAEAVAAAAAAAAAITTTAAAAAVAEAVAAAAAAEAVAAEAEAVAAEAEAVAAEVVEPAPVLAGPGRLSVTPPLESVSQFISASTAGADGEQIW